ncbi:MAG: flagellar biosynthetic protein FliO [Austwickia sp.]|nr:flagellar biosynthetic protein FliO [Actinomycetota bacterium]MCB1252998.1 flagellar biosynthetic protein FliO [Austwickia sp.]MCO5307725.1 flagellar biosynthetic protein FliO [Austwickia sp.]
MTDGSTVALLLRMAVSLAVVLAVIVWAARVLHRRQGGLLGRVQREVPVTVLARQSLSRHAGLSVVEVGPRILVLGVTDAEVSLLTTLDSSELTEDIAAPAAPAASFAEALRHAGGLGARREVKRQAEQAREIADRLDGVDRSGGRHRG